MKPTFRSVALVSLSALSCLMTHAFAKEGGIIGSGGDGLIMAPSKVRNTNPPRPADVEVELPQQLKNYGRIKVVGTPPFKQQEWEFEACRLNSQDGDSHFFLKTVCSSGPLNQAIDLTPGKYWVWFGKSRYPKQVTVNRGQTTTLQLKKLSVPNLPERVFYRASIDYFSAAHQEQLLTALRFGDAFESLGRVISACTLDSGEKTEKTTYLDADAQRLCEAIQKKDWASLVRDRLLIQIDPTSHELTANSLKAKYSKSWGKRYRSVQSDWVKSADQGYLTDRDSQSLEWERIVRDRIWDKDGFVQEPYLLVFPGVYNIEFCDSELNCESKLGIRVD